MPSSSIDEWLTEIELDSPANRMERTLSRRANPNLTQDPFEVEFTSQVIQNPSNKNRYRLTPDEHAEIYYLLGLTREKYLHEHKQLTKQ